MKSRSLGKVKEKEKVYNVISELYTKRFENYHNQYNKLSDAKKISSIKKWSLWA